MDHAGESKRLQLDHRFSGSRLVRVQSPEREAAHAPLTRILVSTTMHRMVWSVELKESVLDDLRWFGKKNGRPILKAALERLEEDPLSETRQMKTLRPNPVAGRELRLFGKYPILFQVDLEAQVVTVVLVGEQRGEALVVQGKEFSEHHESDSSE
jgi:mRNA-degrading endonuclease RelE of RelBE toxin-antitoxin system